MLVELALLGGIALGWGLGGNDAANVFGTAVAARILRYRQAALFCGLAVIIGAFLQGEAGMHTYADLADQSLVTLVITAFASAVTVLLMTAFALPISTSQAVVGAIAGIGLATDTMNWLGLQKVVICWIATPLGGCLLAVILYYILGFLLQKIPMSILTRDKIIWGGLVIMGLYGAYALGANNVANATGIFADRGGELGLTNRQLALVGGLAIAFGSVTIGRRVLQTVGSGIMPLDGFTGLVAVSAMSLTVHTFAIIGVPVSTSQGIVGAIIGIGIAKRSHALKLEGLQRIVHGWLLTPLISLVLAAAGYAIFV